MSDLPPRPDLDQLRHQAKDLLQAARQYGFASWVRLKTEVERREILESRDVTRLRALLDQYPELAVEPMLHWCDHPRGVSPLAYVAMMRYDTSLGRWRDAPGTGPIARALLDAGAPVDGAITDCETPLMTAASYGDVEVAQVLVDAGADLTATASADAGGVPGGTALRHAAVFGMDEVAEVLLTAGATDLVQAAAAGDITSVLTSHTPEGDRVAALRIAAARGRLQVIEQLLAAATPVDGVDADGSTALHEAAYSGRVDSAQHLLDRGADPRRRDNRFHGTPLDWCRHRRHEVGPGHGHDEVEKLLERT